MKTPILTRRNMLWGGVALGALGLGVGGYAATATGEDYFRAMLHAYLPGVTISDAAIRDFSADALIGRQSDFAPKLKALSAMVRVLGFPAVEATLGRSEALEVFNRELFTQFLTSSNFFQLSDPLTETVEYNGRMLACFNPFAQFD